MLFREFKVDIRTASATEAILETRCDLLSVDGDSGSEAWSSLGSVRLLPIRVRQNWSRYTMEKMVIMVAPMRIIKARLSEAGAMRRCMQMSEDSSAPSAQFSQPSQSKAAEMQS